MAGEKKTCRNRSFQSGAMDYLFISSHGEKHLQGTPPVALNSVIGKAAL
jgi:hypothetical protein